jgi:glutathione peroxidase
LEELGAKYGDTLQIMAFPCNQFGGQEPGDAAAIKQFAKEHGFPPNAYLMAKVNVNGPKASEVWVYLKANAKPKPIGSIGWNYHKFLVDANGEPVKHYGSSFDMKAISADIEALLG